MQNVELNNEDSSTQHHNEHESILGQENCDNEGCDNAMYDVSFNNFRILTNIYQDSIINSNIRSLNQKQREVFDIVHKWARDHLKYLSSAVNKQVPPFYMLISD